MPVKGSTVFLRQSGDTARRILFPSTVVETAGSQGLTVSPHDETLAFEVGLELLIYFEHRRQFMQQAARIDALLDREAGPLYILQTIGEPVSAESRQCYRVSTVFSNLSVTFAGEAGCSLRDVSVTGLAIFASGKFAVGEVVDAEFCFEGTHYRGRASIQGVCPTPDGLYRYGCNVVKQAASADSLARGLQQVSMSVQRQQMNRLSGGA